MPDKVDEFQLLGMEKTFDLNLDKLENSYLKLQQLFHPDRFSNLSEKEIRYSTMLSSMINDAYQKLKNSISRANLLLKSIGINPNFDKDSFNDSSVLEEIMEIQNKFLETETSKSKKLLIKELELRISQVTNNISETFQIKNYEEVNKLNIKLSYLEKIRNDFKKQL